MDRTCRAETQRNAALTLIGRFLKTFSQIRGVPQQWFSSQSLDIMQEHEEWMAEAPDNTTQSETSAYLDITCTWMVP